MKAMIDGNTQIRAIAVHVKHMIPSINQQIQAVQNTYGHHYFNYMPPQHFGMMPPQGMFQPPPHPNDLHFHFGMNG